jgi:hypothetical protein
LLRADGKKEHERKKEKEKENKSHLGRRMNKDYNEKN